MTMNTLSSHKSSMRSLAAKLPSPKELTINTGIDAFYPPTRGVDFTTQNSGSMNTMDKNSTLTRPQTATTVPISPRSNDSSTEAVNVTTYIGSEPVSGEQVLADIVQTCTDIAIITGKLKDNGKLLSKLEEIKDELVAHRPKIQQFEREPFIQKRLWELHREAILLSEKAKRYQGMNLLSTAEHKRRKLDQYFGDIQKSWSVLMVNLSMAISGNYPQKTATMEVSPVTQKSPQSPVEGAEALCILGDKYLFGYGVNRCYDSAFKAYFKAATEFQSPEASNMLGSMYEYGLGTAINMENAIKLYTEAAELRNLEALNNLGRIYETGKGLPGKDLQKASFYYLRAAELGHADAQTNIGYLIEHSIGSTADQVSTTLARTGTAFTQSSIEKAAEWYRLAAEKHDYARAQNFLGSLYYTGKGGFRRDYQQALRLFNRAADQGNSHAQNNLGICYEEGVAVERNYEKAKQFYRKASEANHPSATNNLAFLFLLERNYGEAIKTFHIAAALGSVDALYNIGTIFEAGVLHPEGKAEHALALRYFTEAAEKNYSKAQLKVFDYLNDGLCGPKDPQKAVEWLQSAAKLHSPEAQFRLAHAYEIGFGGLPRDFEEAKKWYQKSASLEYTPALLKLGQIFENGELGVEKDLDTALKIYIDAEALGEPDARQFADRIREVLVN